MPKLSDETKNEIIKQYQENMSVNDIIKNLKIGRATYYKVIKEYKDEKSVINTSKQSMDNSTEKSTQTKKNLNTSTDEASESNQEEETVIDKEEETVFDINEFKKELNNVHESHYAEKELNNVHESHYAEKEEDIKTEVLKPVKRPLPTEKSILSNISFARKTNNIIDRSNILDTIKNVNTGGSIEELREKRSLIIIIRQYINTFPKELINIVGSKKTDFEKKLFNQSIEQLNIILENIRVELNLSRNAEMFHNGVSVGLKGIETISKYSGYDVDGLEKELMQDQDFILDLQIISCEVDISKYINPRSSAFLKVVRRMYMLNQQNEIKKQLDTVLNDKNKIDEIKNLDKK